MSQLQFIVGYAVAIFFAGLVICGAVYMIGVALVALHDGIDRHRAGHRG